MINSRRIIPVIILAAIITVVSCGDDETPYGPGTYPTASILSASSGSSNSISLSWTMCPDANFYEYSLYRSLTEGISANPSDNPIRVSTNASDTTFTDSGLEWSTNYYYAVKTRNNDNLDSWSNEVSVTTPDSSGGGGGDVYTCYEIQGQQSSSPYLGQTVGVTGIVVVAGGEYYSSSAAYAVLMDAAGDEWAGLTLFGDDIADLERGDSVTVYGLIDEYYNMTEMKYPFTSIEVHSTGHTLPSPENLNTGDVGLEQWESVLVSVSDVTVTEDNLGYGEWAVDDGTGDIRIDDLGDYTYSPNTGDTFAEIIGVCWYSFDNFKMEPRNDDDLIE